MEKLLARIARQLDSLDEASLMALWSKYATIVSRFEPTQRWEEAALIFSLIQAKHWKNQLFNYNLAKMSRPLYGSDGDREELTFGFSLEPPPSEANSKSRCRILAFHASQKDDAPKDNASKNDGKPE
ncbi:MAG: hypothetical protein IJU76_01135 [Desulfovibrionaceae bacterium]|nr:hypothetical protein [Desulfovibrionaceae bacterium]